MADYDNARAAIQALLEGATEQPATGLDAWQHVYDDLYSIYQSDGVEGVRRAAMADKTIVKLIASGKDLTYTTGQPVPVSARDLAYKDIPPTRYYLEGMLRTGLALYIGNPGIGKTPALLQLAIALTYGGRWMGAFQCRKSRVLYIGVEYDEAYMQELLIDSHGSKDLPDGLFIHTVETFTPPTSEADSIEMMEFYISTMQIDVVIIDTFSGFLPREKFKQDKYRGDYAEFLAYHRISLKHSALILGSWHGTKRDPDPETAYNGGQGMWGSAGGGRLTMFRDNDEEVRLRSQLRGHERQEWLLQQVRLGEARQWAVVDADPEPIFGSDIQRDVYRVVKQYSTKAEPITPAGVMGILKGDDPTSSIKEGTVRQTMNRMADRGFFTKAGGGYIVTGQK
jgi:hypothetical protein